MAKILIPYSPHPQQRLFHDSSARFKAIISGVGFGKSAAGANEFLRTVIKYPKALHLILAPNSKIMHNATLPQFWKFCPKELLLQHLKAQNLIYLVNGSRIIYLTADNERHIDRLRGIEIGHFWADEASLFLKLVWFVILARLRDGNGPLTGIITTTPKGLNWIHDLFVSGIDPNTKQPLSNAKDFAWFGGSSLDNPHTPEEFKKTLMAQYSGRFREQEIFGKFVGFEGLVYPQFSPKIHVIDKTQLPTHWKDVVGGIDWGFSNPQVGLIAGIDHDGRIYVLREFYERRTQVQELGQWFRSQMQRYKRISQIYGDPSSPENIEALNGMGLNVIAAHNEVMEGIQTVDSHLPAQEDGKPRLFVMRRCKNLIDEFSRYRYADKREEKPEREGPIKIHDHALDALRYILHSRAMYGEDMEIPASFDDPDGFVF